MKNEYKIYYSVKFSTLGVDEQQTSWFNNKEDAEKLAKKDYHDDPVAHRVKKAETIAQYDYYCSLS